MFARRNLCVVVVALIALGGCKGRFPQTTSDIDLVQGQLGTQTLFIPQAYFKRGMADFQGGTISMEMQQPEFIPLPKTQSQMWKDGEQTRYISILANEQRSLQDYSEYVEDRISFFQVYKTVESEYGLIHLTQPEGFVQDNSDMWVEREGERNISYITCSEKIAENSVPQCTHAIEVSNLSNIYIQIRYDKRNLPQWKRIEDGVLQAFESFKSPETARESLFAKYQAYQNSTGRK